MSADPTQSRTISVVIVDDHRVLTDALVVVLRNQSDLQVVDVAATCAAARALLSWTCPDVLLLDVLLPDGDGLSLAPEVNRMCPNTHILVLTSLGDETTLMRALETGVNGLVLKGQPLSDVLSGIRSAAEGEIVMPASLFVGLLGRVGRTRARPPAQHGRDLLTPREQEILTCLAKGMSGPAIAAALNIAPNTVRTHIRNLIEKLGVHSRLEAVIHALRRGLIEPPV